MPSATRPRHVLELSGDTVRPWLEGLITNSLSAPVTFAALLTPQGKIIADFMVTDRGDHLLLDTTPEMGPGLAKRLSMYKLREAIEIEDVTDTHPLAVFWGGADGPGEADPRHPSLGTRAFGRPGGSDDYDAHRLSLGVSDSEWDFGPNATFPQDACMDQLNGVDYGKGCFVGQEVVSRMKRLGSVRKRMRGTVLSGPAERGDPLKAGTRTVGQVLHSHNGLAMSLVRLDRLRDATESPTVRGERVDIMDSVLGTDD